MSNNCNGCYGDDSDLIDDLIEIYLTLSKSKKKIPKIKYCPWCGNKINNLKQDNATLNPTVNGRIHRRRG